MLKCSQMQQLKFRTLSVPFTVTVMPKYCRRASCNIHPSSTRVISTK